MTKGKTLRRIRVAEKHLAMYICFLAYQEQGGTDPYSRWRNEGWAAKKAEWQAK
jgi:hypothetical protein